MIIMKNLDRLSICGPVIAGERDNSHRFGRSLDRSEAPGSTPRRGHADARDHPVQGLPGYIFHGDEGGSVIAADLVDGDDVGMGPRRIGARFPRKPPLALSAAGLVGGQVFSVTSWLSRGSRAFQ